jgi:hypothetical protein
LDYLPDHLAPFGLDLVQTTLEDEQKPLPGIFDVVLEWEPSICARIHENPFTLTLFDICHDGFPGLVVTIEKRLHEAVPHPSPDICSRNHARSLPLIYKRTLSVILPVKKRDVMGLPHRSAIGISSPIFNSSFCVPPDVIGEVKCKLKHEIPCRLYDKDVSTQLHSLLSSDGVRLGILTTKVTPINV